MANGVFQFDRLVDIAKAQSAIRVFSPDCDRDEWTEIGMCLCELGDDGKSIWFGWSQGSPRWDERAAENAWRSFKPGGGLNLATLLYRAKERGWDGRYDVSQPLPTLPKKSKHAPKTDDEPQRIYPTIDRVVQSVEYWAPRSDKYKGCGSFKVFAYPYSNADGVVVMLLVRLNYFDEFNKPKKQLIAYRAVAGGFCSALTGNPPPLQELNPRPLFDLPKILAAQTVIVCEGEKKAVGLNELFDSVGDTSCRATTSAFGADNPDKSDWSVLSGKNVVLWPDADTSGAAYADVISSLLLASPNPPISLRRLPTDGRPAKYDAINWLDEQPDSAPPEVVVESLHALLATAVDVVPSTPTDAPPVVSTVASDGDDTWPEPREISELTPVMPFDLSQIPPAFRGWIEDICERMQVPPDMPAVSLAVTLAGVIGNKITIRPKRQDDWTVVPNLWAAVVGAPGTMKSAAIGQPLRALDRLEVQAAEEMRPLIIQSQAQKKVNAARAKHLDQAIERAVRAQNDEEATSLALELAELANEPEVTSRRYVVRDSTYQQIGVLLADNPHGLVVYRDELSGIFSSFEQSSQEGARQFYLESWTGLETNKVERRSRPPAFIRHSTLSIIGTTQPTVLAKYIKASATQSDGFMQRFQLLVWPDVQQDFVNVDRWPDSNAKNAAWQAICRLDQLTPQAARCECPPDGELPFLRFCSDAQDLADNWRSSMEHRIRSGELDQQVEMHISKYRSLMPSLALLFHLGDGKTGPVSVGATETAIKWMDYLESHAIRAYTFGAGGDQRAKTILDRILAGELGDGFALRDVYRSQKDGIKTPRDASSAVRILEDHGYVRLALSSGAGRPAKRYQINPALAGQTSS